MPTYAIPSPAPPSPVHTQERVQVLDILRGFALFGMIVVHFHQRVNTTVSGIEDLIGWTVWVGVETKSWGTFAFLFGVGFAVLLRRIEAKGLPFLSIYLRRLAVLALFGVAAEALFGFQVLLGYAIWGVPLLFLRRLSTRTLLLVALLALASRMLLGVGAAAGLWPPLTTEAEVTAGRALSAAMASAGEGGSFVELVLARLEWMRFKYFRLDALVPDVTLALFILGLLAVRHGLVDQPRRHARVILSWMTFGFLCWAVYWALIFPSEGLPGLLQAAYVTILNEQWLCLTFIGAVTLLVTYRPVWLPRLSLFGWAGRMALTNYMLQVAALDFIVSGYGLSLRLRPLYGMVGAALLFGTEAAFSRVWLSRFRFGPCEWLWRTLTYGKRQPMRVVAAEAELAAAR